MTYRNAYEMLGDLRHSLNEYNTGLHNGTSTSGKYDNGWLMREGINDAQAKLYELLVLRKRDLFLEGPSDIAVTSSVITLPSTFGKMEELRDSDGRKVFPSEVKHLPANGAEGTDRLYYQKGNTLVLNKSGVTDTYSISYTRKPRELNQGAASGANTLATTAVGVADYYNGMTIESITGGWVGEISDYTAARVITVSGQTLTSGHYYGVVSDLPEEYHKHIVPLATLLCKNKHPASQEKATVKDMRDWTDSVWDTIRAFSGNEIDTQPEDIWCDGGQVRSSGYNIPGHSNIVW